MANDIVNDIANCIVNAINNCIDSNKANSPVHVKVNDLANAIDKESVNRIVKVYPMLSQWQNQKYLLCLG